MLLLSYGQTQMILEVIDTDLLLILLLCALRVDLILLGYILPFLPTLECQFSHVVWDWL